jgi:Arc/MetJ family transcription regulator
MGHIVKVDIDSDLLAKAMQAAGKDSDRATVEEALRILIQFGLQQEALERLRGIGWEGDLDAMREGRGF